MRAIIKRKIYDTTTALAIANDGILSQYHKTTATTLYKTVKGAFFLHFRTMWQGERNTITVIDIEAAKDFFENAVKTEMEYSEAFACNLEEG